MFPLSAFMSRLYCHANAGRHLEEGAVTLTKSKKKQKKTAELFKGSAKTTEDDSHTLAHETAALIVDTLWR